MRNILIDSRVLFSELCQSQRYIIKGIARREKHKSQSSRYVMDTYRLPSEALLFFPRHFYSFNSYKTLDLD